MMLGISVLKPSTNSLEIWLAESVQCKLFTYILACNKRITELAQLFFSRIQRLFPKVHLLELLL